MNELIRDTVDLHYHSAPSPFPRRMDPVEAAQHFDEHGFKAVVLKSHHHNTVMDVLTIQRSVLDKLRVKVFGGIALNGLVGGLNPRAVEMSLRMGGKVVWFPTMSSPAHIAHHADGAASGFPTATMKLMPEAVNSVFDDAGKLKPEVYQIIELIKEEDAILSSGHMPPAEIFAVFKAAREAGVEKLIVAHPDFIVDVSHDQACELAKMGAFIEHEANMWARDRPERPIANLISWIRDVGPEHTTIGSDTGQATSPTAAEVFGKLAQLLVDNGVAERDVRRMLSDNPGSLLGVS
ncbi:MAG: hypothetical protein JO020_16545 [Chloroflexi bacterium]|nr:hypothetical protein [Chloroflexota bacterium]MBV9895775.1 hypothetical protein [Chloroflexota bacterium]